MIYPPTWSSLKKHLTSPTEIRFGRGRLSEAGEVVSRFGLRCLIVSTPVIPAFEPVIDQLKRSLREAGIECAHFDRVIPNPTTDVVNIADNSRVLPDYKNNPRIASRDEIYQILLKSYDRE